MGQANGFLRTWITIVTTALVLFAALSAAQELQTAAAIIVYVVSFGLVVLLTSDNVLSARQKR